MDYIHEIDTLIQEVSLANGKPISRDKKDWIITNCRRIDMIIDADLGVFTLELRE